MPTLLDDHRGRSARIGEQIRKEQTQLLVRQLPMSSGATLAAMGLVMAILWESTPHALLLNWYALVALISLARLGLFVRSRRPHGKPGDWKRDVKLITLFSGLSGLACGFAGLMPIFGASSIEQSYILLILSGMAAVGVATIGPLPSAYFFFIFPLLLPAAGWLSIQKEPTQLGMGIMVLALLLLLAATERTYAKTLLTALRLRFENSALIGNLQRARRVAETSNTELKAEIDQRQNAEQHTAVYARKLRRLNKALKQEIAEREKNEQALTRQALNILESEVRMRAIFQAAFDGILTVRSNGTIESCNPAAETLFGYTREQMEAMNIRELVPLYPEQEGATQHLHEVAGRRIDTSPIPLAMSVDSMHLGNEELRVCILRDITEAQMVKEELIKAKNAAESANHAKSEFLSSMSHELRTPLNAILGFAQLLESDPTTPLNGDQKESIEQILKAGWHLLELINDVLDLAKIEAGRMDTSLENIQLDELLQECAGLIVASAEQRGLALEIPASDSGLVVRADYTRLKQVILNLLSNAIKYNRDQGTVSLLPPEVCNGRCRIGIGDTGKGLSDEQLKLIFQPFVRVADNKEQIEGTGIGLTITRKLLALMDGQISAESTPGKGSIFWIEIPLGSAPSLVGGLPQLLDADTLDAASATAGHTLLYVEDNPANLNLVKNILKQHRPDVRLLSASDGESGLMTAMEEQPDLILLDISLPVMNGFEVLERLQENERLQTTPTFAISANAMPSDIEKGLQAGFLYYLTKPIEVDEFLSALDAILEKLTSKVA